MPLRAGMVGGSPAVKWGRRGRLHRYGLAEGRTLRQAAALAIRDGRRKMARRVAREEALRGDARRRRGRKYGGRVARYSDRLIAQHRKVLVSRVRLMEAVFLRVAGLRADADVIDAVQLQVVLRTVREVVERGAEQDRDGIAWIAREVDEDVTDTVDAQISHQVGRPVVSAVPARDVIDRWVDDNVGLIRSIATTAHDDVAEVIREGAMAGTTTRDLTRQIAQRFNVAQSRGELIARDQTAKLSSQINQERQREHGVTRYQWSSSGDERVRQRHAELDGQIFDWSAPPIADERAGLRGHPGEIWQCRCDAEPVLEEDDVPGLLRRARTQQERELALLRESPIVTGEIGSIYDWNRKRLRELARGESSAVGL